ncbi:hypothetical protein PIB30_005311 [Stylosanthes scabra]|uniref:RRM domain-containing protein n=1 Tax=Stylosanthes scabra TaxID=79078 RepID=A0ABU6U3T9_9FABA|nr:hypothetical protein [Stylosanthes scabra]
MERKGVSWVPISERGKHGEVSGHAGRRNKEESGGEFVSSVRRNIFWVSTTKRELYKEFGKCGFVKDIFISRKKRRNTEGTFAFVRYCEDSWMIRAINRLNGVLWNGRKLFVSESRYTWGGRVQRQPLLKNQHKEMKKGRTQKWIPVKQKQTDESDNRGHNKESGSDRRKEIQGIWAEDQTERMQRSLLGVCVKPIEFRKVMNRLLEEWNGSGSVESRDIGPYRCLITFPSVADRDATMKDDLLLSMFDEVRLLWDFTLTLSRRVWVEIFGLSINLWCEPNIRRIVELWGKVVMMDDRTEEAKTFSTARVLINSFHWEMINEWITIKIDDRAFKVFAKEVGPEVYSVESHPDRGEVISETIDDVNEKATSDVSSRGIDTSPAVAERSNLNLLAVNDPLTDVLINEKLNYVHQLKMEREICGDVIMESVVSVKEIESCVPHQMQNSHMDFLGYDPAWYEAQLVFGCYAWDTKRIDYVGPNNNSHEEQFYTDESCPFPPGFGPCSRLAHVHKKVIRAQQNSSPCKRDRRSSGVSGDLHINLFQVASIGEGSAVGDGDTESDETRYLINKQAFVGLFEVDDDVVVPSDVPRLEYVNEEHLTANDFSNLGVPETIFMAQTITSFATEEDAAGQGALYGAQNDDFLANLGNLDNPSSER